ESTPVRVCGDTSHDFQNLAGFPALTAHTVNVTGMNALNPTAEGELVHLETMDGVLTLTKPANMRANGGDTFVAQSFPLPEGVMLLPTLEPFKNAKTDVPRTSGYAVRLRLDNAVLVGMTDPPFNDLALPALQVVSGSVTDAQNQ